MNQPVHSSESSVDSPRADEPMIYAPADIVALFSSLQFGISRRSLGKGYFKECSEHRSRIFAIERNCYGY